MNDIESMLLRIADSHPDVARDIHTAIERMRAWREEEAARQARKRATYTQSMLTYVDAATAEFENDAHEWERRERDRIARVVATDKRWHGTYTNLCELLSQESS